MPDFGLLPEGFVPKTVEIIVAETEERIRGRFGKSFPLSEITFAGFLNRMYAEREALIWEILDAIHSSTDPDKASGAALRALGLLTGTFELAPTASTVVESLCGIDATVVPAGTVASTTSTGKRFSMPSPAVIIAVSAWTVATPYFVGDQVTNAGRCYRCTVEGISAGSGGPTTAVDVPIVDNTVRWAYLGEGTATVDTVFASFDTGPVVAAAFDLTTIETPVGGLLSVRNLADAKLGRGEQTDESFRILREAELSKAGTGPTDAIRADLLAVPNVISVTVFFNDQDDPVDGMPPHSVEAMVEGGVDQDIWTQLLASIACGITPWGTQIGTATDSVGTSHVERFTRPDNVLIYADVTVIKDPAAFPLDGVPQIKQKIVDFALAQKGGKDAVASSIGAQSFGVTGVEDVVQTLIYTDAIGAAAAWIATHAYVATVGARSVVTNDGGRTYICITGGVSAGAGGPTGVGTDIVDGTVHWYFLGNTIPINLRQRAKFDTSRISVHTLDGTP